MLKIQINVYDHSLNSTKIYNDELESNDLAEAKESTIHIINVFGKHYHFALDRKHLTPNMLAFIEAGFRRTVDNSLPPSSFHSSSSSSSTTSNLSDKENSPSDSGSVASNDDKPDAAPLLSPATSAVTFFNNRMVTLPSSFSGPTQQIVSTGTLFYSNQLYQPGTNGMTTLSSLPTPNQQVAPIDTLFNSGQLYQPGANRMTTLPSLPAAPSNNPEGARQT